MLKSLETPVLSYMEVALQSLFWHDIDNWIISPLTPDGQILKKSPWGTDRGLSTFLELIFSVNWLILFTSNIPT